MANNTAKTVLAPGLVAVRASELTVAQRVIRRVIDLAIVLVVLILLIVPILVIMALVVTTSRGPILYTQTRVGRSGRHFNVLKFRTMRCGTHTELLSNEQERQRYRQNDFKIAADDPRITKAGWVLRKTSLDELPQLVNVFWGDMSIVGIRPLLPDELGLRPEHDQRLYRSLRPGMTGLWQVEGRSRVDQADRIALDRRYAEQWSVWNDVKILLRTPCALVKVHRAH
jgi:lipopolysaccharide/colanic/teichoic acid biosynthesis glycosyltransferase